MGYNRNNNDVADVFYPNRDRIRDRFDDEDFCRAVRRCLIRDLVAAERDDSRDDDRDRCRKRHW
ncbi:MAG TPA: hypothetical protein DCR24_01195 [Bacillus bacterium]|nr:hypothetical protein [Bacillus sp. (in: firmicutes)]